MRPYLITAAVAAAFLVGCGDDSAPVKAPDTSMPKAPTTASGGATGASPNAAPAGEKVPMPASPKASGSGETKPDPGDANDHSNPQHDAKQK